MTVVQFVAVVLTVALLSVSHRMAYENGILEGIDRCNAMLDAHLETEPPTFNNSHVEPVR